MSNELFALCGTRRATQSKIAAPVVDGYTKLTAAERRLGRIEGLIEQDAAMRWPYRAQGFIVGGIFVALCFVGAGFL